ncbi:ECF transporter S component [Gottschalkiaceae bacterium SANA]|nr:ECF transporter S component [Gottschalkiaceae bacterium SANA]
MTTSMKTKWIVKVGMLSAVAFLLQLLELPLGIFPAFLQIDFSDVPALLAGFSLGPAAGVVVELIKNLLHLVLKNSGTGGVGELANFLIGSAMVIPAAMIYKRKHSRRTAIYGLIAGTLVMALVGVLANLYLLIPFYANAFGMPVEAIVSMGTVVNSAITDLTTLVLYSIVPFNLLKGLLISIVTVLIYKRLSPVLHK